MKYTCLKPLLLLAFLSSAHAGAWAQAPAVGEWRGKNCAVVLTYDDALDVDLDHVLPALDSAGLRATFYLFAASPAVPRRLAEWRAAAGRGHELGNHSLFHSCDGGLPGRSFVTPENDLRNYTLGRATQEIRVANTLLQAIDNQSRRTFAYPCGDLRVGDSLLYPRLRRDFVAARGVQPGLPTLRQVPLDNVPAYPINGETGAQLIALVQQAQQKHALLVFLFHGVGGGHPLNVSRGAHKQLLAYLHQHEAGIWVAPMVEVAAHVQQAQSRPAGKR